MFGDESSHRAVYSSICVLTHGAALSPILALEPSVPDCKVLTFTSKQATVHLFTLIKLYLIHYGEIFMYFSSCFLFSSSGYVIEKF